MNKVKEFIFMTLKLNLLSFLIGLFVWLLFANKYIFLTWLSSVFICILFGMIWIIKTYKILTRE
jgi:hypothetical protein